MRNEMTSILTKRCERHLVKTKKMNSIRRMNACCAWNESKAGAGVERTLSAPLEQPGNAHESGDDAQGETKRRQSSPRRCRDPTSVSWTKTLKIPMMDNSNSNYLILQFNPQPPMPPPLPPPEESRLSRTWRGYCRALRGFFNGCRSRPEDREALMPRQRQDGKPKR